MVNKKYMPNENPFEKEFGDTRESLKKLRTEVSKFTGKKMNKEGLEARKKTVDALAAAVNLLRAKAEQVKGEDAGNAEHVRFKQFEAIDSALVAKLDQANPNVTAGELLAGLTEGKATLDDATGQIVLPDAELEKLQDTDLVDEMKSLDESIPTYQRFYEGAVDGARNMFPNMSRENVLFVVSLIGAWFASKLDEGGFAPAAKSIREVIAINRAKVEGWKIEEMAPQLLAWQKDYAKWEKAKPEERGAPPDLYKYITEGRDPSVEADEQLKKENAKLKDEFVEYTKKESTFGNAIVSVKDGGEPVATKNSGNWGVELPLDGFTKEKDGSFKLKGASEELKKTLDVLRREPIVTSIKPGAFELKSENGGLAVRGTVDTNLTEQRLEKALQLRPGKMLDSVAFRQDALVDSDKPLAAYDNKALLINYKVLDDSAVVSKLATKVSGSSKATLNLEWDAGKSDWIETV